jgi:isoleucyl-tRNA synthetase
LRELAGELPEEFDPHRPFIDEVTFSCPTCQGRMQRTPGVIDVWFDSGAMPFAQWHYPFENQEAFEAHFPADFICEAIDQTRGWFYSLLAISTMLGRGKPFRSAMVNGHILDEEGQKMSKSRGNVVDPWDAVGEHGADVIRWYLVTVSQPGASKRYDPEGVREVARKVFDTLFNTYRFFSLYASAEGWEPSGDDPDLRPLLDRWILSRFQSLVSQMEQELSAYQVTRAYRMVADFLGEDLSNWYVRRSRSRFWGSAESADARAAFRTLWEILVGLTRLMAPLSPFSSDWIHRALTSGSVHLASFPEADLQQVDASLEEGMAAVRALVTLGRAAREEVQIRVRQPLKKMYAVTPGPAELPDELLAVLKEELNVKEVAFLRSAEDLVTLQGRPNFRTLGPRFQKRTEEAASAIRALPPQALRSLRSGEAVEIQVGGQSFALSSEEVEVVEAAAGGLVVQSDGSFTAALDPDLDQDLLREGLARELVNRIQRLRKDSGLEITDRISLGVFGDEEVQTAAELFRDFVAGETLATRYRIGGLGEASDFDAIREVDMDGCVAEIALSRQRP